MKFVYLRNSTIKSWRSSRKRRKKPIWEESPESKVHFGKDSFPRPWDSACASSRPSEKLLQKQIKNLPEERVVTSGSQAGQAAGSGDMASSSTAALGLHWQGPCPTWHTEPAQQHIQPRVQSPETWPAVQHPPKHPPRSHPLSLSNWQLQLYSWILFRAHSQPQFSHLPVCQLFPSRSSLTSCAMPKSLAYSLSPGQAALLSFAQRDCNLSQALCQQAGSQSKHIQACQM